MRKLFSGSVTIGLFSALLIAGGAWGQEEETWPEGPTFDGNFEMPDVAGEFNPLRVTTEDVSWDGGSASIPFTLSQRGTVWLAVYQTDSNETGGRGPGCAWLRLEAQDLFVAVTPGQAFEAGSHTISWDGNDFEGNAAGPGSYEFDIIAINNLDKPSLAGPGSTTGFGQNLIDTRSDPPEIWAHESERENADAGERAGDMMRGTLGTDYLANPNAWEEWSFNNVLDFEGARTLGGTEIDDQDAEIFWTTHHSGEFGGLYKMIINRAAQGWDSDESFGDNGHSPNKTDRVVGIGPWGDIVYVAHWGRSEVPFCSIESRDKVTGEIIAEADVTEFYTRDDVDDEGNEVTWGLGPGQIGVGPGGVTMTSWGTPNIAHINHDGDLLWVNQNGDRYGDRLSNEAAALLGHAQGANGSNMQIEPDASGNVIFFCQAGNTDGAHINALGRDGSALFQVYFPSSIGPFRPDQTWYITVIDDDGGDYDGIFYGTQWRLIEQDWTRPEGARKGASAMFYFPYEVASGALGVATAVEELAAADVPYSYELSDAYPNPFNPSTTIEFNVPGHELVKVDIYNSAGQFVVNLANEELAPGAYKTTWDGRDHQGREVASGVYTYRMRSGTFTATKSMTFIK